MEIGAIENLTLGHLKENRHIFCIIDLRRITDPFFQMQSTPKFILTTTSLCIFSIFQTQIEGQTTSLDFFKEIKKLF